MDRRPGSGRPVTVTTEKNEELIGDLICSQEENPITNLSSREIEKVKEGKSGECLKMIFG